MTNLSVLQNLKNCHSITKALTLFDCFIHSISQNCMSGEFQNIRAESQQESKDAHSIKILKTIQYLSFQELWDTMMPFCCIRSLIWLIYLILWYHNKVQLYRKFIKFIYQSLWNHIRETSAVLTECMLYKRIWAAPLAASYLTRSIMSERQNSLYL